MRDFFSSFHVTLPCWMFTAPKRPYQPPLSPQSSMPAVMTMLADHAARQLLDFNQKLDINLLDNVVNCLYHGVGPQVRILTLLCRVTSSEVYFYNYEQTVIFKMCQKWNIICISLNQIFFLYSVIKHLIRNGENLSFQFLFHLDIPFGYLI